MTPSERFRREHPLVEQVEVLVPDLLGIARGKRLPVDHLDGLLEGRHAMSTTVLSVDVRGENVDDSPFVEEEGDADRPVRADPATLRPAPWRPDRALVLASFTEADGSPFWGDTRRTLAALRDRLRARGLEAVAAFEFEFYLLADGGGPPRPLASSRRPGAGEAPEVYDLDRLAEVDEFLDTLATYAAALGLELEAVSAEYAPAQFEVNLRHRADALRAADEALLFRIAVRRAAARVGLRATFMAKPFAERSGSGMHVHLSLLDGEGRNLFGETPEGERWLRRAVGGLLAAMPESMAIFAPNANSYRRLVPGSYAPVRASWGHNNRTVAVRIPAAPPAARRLEHRTAGADAHPHLVLAAILAALLDGLDADRDPGPPARGNAYDHGPPLPVDWGAALDRFATGPALARHLDPRLLDLYRQVRRCEYERYRRRVPDLDHAWYLPVY